MENNQSKGILVSYTDLNNIIDKYEFLMFTLSTQITPTINRMIRLQKEVQNLNTLIIKVQSIEKNLIQVNQTIENSTNQILNEKIDKAITLEINKKSKILDEIIEKQNKKIYNKEDVKDYINFYNYKRFHESLQYKKPIEVYFNSMKINEQNYNSKQISVA